MAVLITGGAGYIGSHTCVELLEAGYDVVVIDNLCNSKEESIRRVCAITGKQVRFYKADLRDRQAVEDVFRNEQGIDSVIHFAGLKAVGESVAKPFEYYHNNVTGSYILCSAMMKFNVKNIVFSSSATVYGTPQTVPITEDFPIAPVNPYGRSKVFIEQFLKDLNYSDSAWNIALLRYFNPVGAHKSGRIGEDPTGIPNNLMPFISQVAIGRQQYLKVFGADYHTPDGTGVRDYIHITDLAAGHIKALEKIKSGSGVVVYNLGTGCGYSVFDMITAFEKASGRQIPYKVVERRSGDVAVCYADPSRARIELGWTANRSIDEMCQDVWRWQMQNPDGYRS